MTPLDAAEHEMEERGFNCNDGDVRAIVAAFLDAAMANDTIKQSIHYRVSQAAGVVQPSEPPLPMWFCSATIMALREMV